MKFSKLFSLNQREFIRGLVIAVAGAAIAVAQEAWKAGSLVPDWTQVGLAALTAGGSYLSVKFFTPTPKVIEIDPEKTEVIPKQ